MANRANTTTSEDWRRRTLCFSLDEFCGCKVTISVQQNYQKTRSQKIASSYVNGSWNAEAFGRRRSNYLKKQQVGSAGMQVGSAGMRVGLRTRGDLPGSQTNSGRKSQVRQNKRGKAADRIQAIQEEVGKLVKAGIMKEVHYHDWLSNPVMMPFGLRNVGATYQHLVDKAFHKQIGRNLEVYVDDLVIKSRMEDEIVRDIEKRFKTLREINMKLNPKKYTFGVEEGILLGYKVNTKGLKVCPDKVDVVLSLPSPKCLKDVQKLNGKLASLNRFLAKSAEKSLSFFKTLKKMHKEK
ncbi:reverse transcriptase domain-containing protein [Tanacetum coccineum]